ncbi:hypothetical protein HOG47_04230 [archaeon]|jgi:hypothetical protein|nr:hypothetical protein [archaeon]
MKNKPNERDIKSVNNTLNKYRERLEMDIENPNIEYQMQKDIKKEYVELYSGKTTNIRRLNKFIRVYEWNRKKEILQYIRQYLLETILNEINKKLLEDDLRPNPLEELLYLKTFEK